MLANSALQFNKLRGPLDRIRESPTAMHYHQLALSSMRAQLETSDGRATLETIACISAFICWTVRFPFELY